MISACLADISMWMASHHLKLNLDKTDLLFMSYKTSPLEDLSITVDGTMVAPPALQGTVLDNQLYFKEHIRATSQSCRFLLYNIRRIQPYLTTYSIQLLVQTIVTSCLDYCNSLLASLPACSILPLQLVQNPATRLVFNLPKFSHVTPLLRSLHWLPVAARIRFKGPGLHCSQKDRPLLPTGLNRALHSSLTTSICCSRATHTSFHPYQQLSLEPTAELFHPSSPVVEQTPHSSTFCSNTACVP
ncbi:hypothetical protein SKAU_G00020800 [Synaphobranchus kaupii]|uniref:Reverse transcriptase domain-containing protein n=1 Tax=Synaphobranchus kaupii TaxID=118154 RepID=A0A9Q1GDL3_SYNKA|nr:hypothetical protein SKAU_G00020800 [Synaphobranchus kaupii]